MTGSEVRKRDSKLTMSESSRSSILVVSISSPSSLMSSSSSTERVVSLLSRVESTHNSRSSWNVLLSESSDTLRHQDTVVLSSTTMSDLIFGLSLSLVLVVSNGIFRESVENVTLVFGRLSIDPGFEVSTHLSLNGRVVIVEVGVVECGKNCEKRRESQLEDSLGQQRQKGNSLSDAT